MAKIKDILAGNAIGKVNKKKQHLSSAMAWQILNLYSNQPKNSCWNPYKNLRGVLLADEVGCGKTFEALAIVTKAFLENINARKSIFRVLIVVNPAIRSKWEWTDHKSDLAKFVNQANIKNRNHKEKLEYLFKNMIRIKSKKDWIAIKSNLPTKCIILSSIQSLPKVKGSKIYSQFRKREFPANKFNWIIADEAHIVKSGYSQTEEDISKLNNTAIRKLYAILNSQEKAKILLLTATPFHNNVKEFKHMISLLEHKSEEGIVKLIGECLTKVDKEFSAIKDSINENHDLYSRLNTIYKALENDINILFPGQQMEFDRPKDLKNNGQKNGLNDLLRDVMIRSNKKRLEDKLIELDLDERTKLKYLLLRDLVSVKEDTQGMISSQLCQLVSNSDSFRRSICGNINTNNKRSRLYNLINEYFYDTSLYKLKLNGLLTYLDNFVSNGKSVVTVFCRFIPAIDALEKDLAKTYRVWKLDGRMKPDNRKKLLNDIETQHTKDKKISVLLVSQVGNEGLDFDQFSNTIIHFDGHYNPAIMDQRNGRVYRRNNKAKDIRLHQLVLQETYDQRIKFIELEKKRLKNFYLGDGTLEEIFEKILKLDQTEKKKKLLRIMRFKIDLEPKKENLLPSIRKEII